MNLKIIKTLQENVELGCIKIENSKFVQYVKPKNISVIGGYLKYISDFITHNSNLNGEYCVSVYNGSSLYLCTMVVLISIRKNNIL